MKKELDWSCRQCGKNTKNDIDFYMVKNEIWKKYSNNKRILCWSCLEHNMGRKITKRDLTSCLLNKDNKKAKELIKGK